MKVSWADVSYTRTPGKFSLFGGVLEVSDFKIAIWESKPTAIFAVIPIDSHGDNKQRYVLGVTRCPKRTERRPRSFHSLHTDGIGLAFRFRLNYLSGIVRQYEYQPCIPTRGHKPGQKAIPIDAVVRLIKVGRL
jgi:hypothetical protein